jgi:NAD(P)H-dependent flavin oxidoreductase YrpB (nitropropane dioxygenase family)
MTRSRRNRFVERWSGREWALRRDRVQALEKLNAARNAGDIEEGSLSMGQDAGLIQDIPPAAEIVTRIARQAEEILTQKMAPLVVRK